ncbi:unnamed protein product [Cylicocyclus nassatus]|uniref:Uncharacterized protein n=1 Tax=Cylicocyclus nassatus TaxID=53992 RepID=A0AA36H944_CYLNA|nr:unnamed protein product [Cylicocyclus nassatus]
MKDWTAEKRVTLIMDKPLPQQAAKNVPTSGSTEAELNFWPRVAVSNGEGKADLLNKLRDYVESRCIDAVREYAGDHRCAELVVDCRRSTAHSIL